MMIKKWMGGWILVGSLCFAQSGDRRFESGEFQKHAPQCLVQLMELIESLEYHKCVSVDAQSKLQKHKKDHPSLVHYDLKKNIVVFAQAQQPQEKPEAVTRIFVMSPGRSPEAFEGKVSVLHQNPNSELFSSWALNSKIAPPEGASYWGYYPNLSVTSLRTSPATPLETSPNALLNLGKAADQVLELMLERLEILNQKTDALPKGEQSQVDPYFGSCFVKNANAKQKGMLETAIDHCGRSGYSTAVKRIQTVFKAELQPKLGPLPSGDTVSPPSLPAR